MAARPCVTENCHCVVEYDPGTGKRQNAHTKRWTEDAAPDKIEGRKRITVHPDRSTTKAEKRRTIPANGRRTLRIPLQLFAESDIKRQGSGSLIRAIRKYQRRIQEHQDYINNPGAHISNWDQLDPRRQAGLIRHWEKEIRNFRESIQNRVDELKQRGDYHE